MRRKNPISSTSSAASLRLSPTAGWGAPATLQAGGAAGRAAAPALEASPAGTGRELVSQAEHWGVQGAEVRGAQWSAGPCSGAELPCAPPPAPALRLPVPSCPQLSTPHTAGFEENKQHQMFLSEQAESQSQPCTSQRTRTPRKRRSCQSDGCLHRSTLQQREWASSSSSQPGKHFVSFPQVY